MKDLEILMQALRLEQEGRQFYLQAAERSMDPETTTMFQSLASDEQDHAQYIERQLQARKEGRPWQKVPELDQVKKIDLQAPIFPKGISAIKKLPNNPTEEDALLFGLGIESKSFELYSKHARQSQEPEACELFEKLASAERGHFDLLMLRYEARFGYPR